jgi:hypothetical protein
MEFFASWVLISAAWASVSPIGWMAIEHSGAFASRSQTMNPSVAALVIMKRSGEGLPLMT